MSEQPRQGLRLRGLCAGYPARRGHRERRVLDGLDAVTPPGELTVLIGPNGTGKSTLLRTMAALQPALAGQVLIDDTDITTVDAAGLARRLAVVLTERDLPPLLSARELAGLGRHPHTGFTGRLSAADHAVVTWALEAAQAAHLAERPVSELSDGERQRVLVARALAQEPTVILLDEPTAFLDVTSRVALMGLLRRLARERSLTVVVSTHDLELALRVADRIWLIDSGGALRCGTPEELTLDGSIATSFDGDELSFDAASGVFVLQGGTAGAARVIADGLHRPLLERALAREGWRPANEGPAELAVRWTGDGYESAFDGQTRWFAAPGELAPWARQWATQLADGPKPGLRPATARTVTDALADVATISAYFDIEPGPLELGWRPLTDLLTDPDPLSGKVTEVADRLNTTEMRVAASILFQGLAARLWSPVIGAVVAREVLIDLAPAQVFWQPSPSGPLPLRAACLTGWEIVDPERVAGPLYRNVVTELLEPLAQTVQEITKIAPGLLWGNVASALAGTVRTIARRRPELASRVSALGRELLSVGLLEGSGELVEPAPGHPFFVRRSCCLYYRLPDGGKCGDCALIDPPTRREQWTKAVGGEG
ncbi:ATP-binding cassette domain-containing protein [Streptosporangium sp. 'caverna']|uniref:ATP-binding cassette domain-containing protein n=1 Tax=Streptosporangium sp. 'caverna' TaxID=2202249 RepID=UPI000D7DD9D6|nr:ATP-binding cassette domain-containing protein [Streptosporangium sp. 'caverna']AWS43861.1 ABC transporter [Streptosporangium sp. 'caverna']